MSFISIEFFVFSIVIFSLYFILRQPLRWMLLLVGSYLFYIVGNGNYVFILIFSTITDYWIARQLIKTDHILRRKLLLSISLFLNLSVLFFFKYYNFFSGEVGNWVSTLNIDFAPPMLDVILPIGISFYTFQALSYTIDVYRGEIQPETNLGIFATFIVFFPQLVAGPIERASNLLPQISQQFTFDEDRIVSGLRLALWGFFKKVVIADRLSIYVNNVYASPEDFSGQMLLVATLFFAFQIYCDFSGYSDIAIGVARILGIRLITNFRQPYFSQSIREFWRRWHISLSQWFRDYVYIPLGGNRVSFRRNLLNLIIVFILSGLWHGASWTFVIWGTIHGGIIIVETLLSRNKPQSEQPPSLLKSILKTTVTFIIVVIAWVFFRADTLDDALYILTHFHHIDWSTLNSISIAFNRDDGVVDILRHVNILNYSFQRLQFILSGTLIALLLTVDYIEMHYGMTAVFNRLPTLIRWSAYNLAILAIVFLGAWGNQQFIYFQF
jgi:alginate O-acetyltransferase complex protein AlgI